MFSRMTTQQKEATTNEAMRLIDEDIEDQQIIEEETSK